MGTVGYSTTFFPYFALPSATVTIIGRYWGAAFLRCSASIAWICAPVRVSFSSRFFACEGGVSGWVRDDDDDDNGDDKPVWPKGAVGDL